MTQPSWAWAGTSLLQKDRDFFRVQTAGQIQGDQIFRVFAQILGLDGHGDGVLVGDEDKHLVFFLIFF